MDLRYVLDQAEIPTVQERRLPDAEVLERKRREAGDGLTLRVDGREVPLRMAPGGRLSHPRGAAGLATTRVELALSAGVKDPRRVEVRDDTFPGRVGWKAIVARPGDDTAVRTAAPSGDPTDGLRRYPQDLLSSPLDRREASFSVRPGDGTLTAPRAEGEKVATSRAGGDGFTAVFEDAATGEGVLALLLLAAFGWGALHALSGTARRWLRRTWWARAAPPGTLALGATVTVTHTIGVFALGWSPWRCRSTCCRRTSIRGSRSCRG